jgi:hypothetical protein
MIPAGDIPSMTLRSIATRTTAQIVAELLTVIAGLPPQNKRQGKRELPS